MAGKEDEKQIIVSVVRESDKMRFWFTILGIPVAADILWALPHWLQGERTRSVWILAGGAFIAVAGTIWILLASRRSKRRTADGKETKDPRIIVDRENEIVVFENFPVAKSFRSRTVVPELVCRFADLRAVYRQFQQMTIATSQGSIEVCKYMSHFDEVHRILREVAKTTPSSTRWYDSPRTLWLIATAVMLVLYGLVVLAVHFDWLPKWLKRLF